MTLPIYLAMIAEELRSCLSLPENIAYMACHYAPYGTGLANLPEQFSQDMLLILNDRIPPTVHDPQLIIEQLTDIAPSQILLDFQQPDMPINHAVTQLIAQNTSVSVCCSQPYGNGLSCAVAVELPPPHLPLDQHLAPWSGREIWLDLDISAYIYTVTTDGAAITNNFNGGTFKGTVYCGRASNTNSTHKHTGVYGDIVNTFKGGTFSGTVYGGSAGYIMSSLEKCLFGSSVHF